MTMTSKLLPPGQGCQRWLFGRDSYRVPDEVINTRDYEVAPIDEAPAKAFVVTHHYSRTYPAARFRFGLFRGPALVGVGVYSQPVRNEVLTNVFATGSALDSVELGRFVLLDSVAANGESYFLSRCHHQLRREGLVGVLSFSDPVPRTDLTGRTVFQGHLGLIYQAGSAAYLGRGTARTLRILPDGRALSERALSKIRGGEQGWRYAMEQLLGHGARPIRDDEAPASWLAEVLPTITRRLPHPGNLKYGFALHRSARRFLEGALPYPKRHTLAA